MSRQDEYQGEVCQVVTSEYLALVAVTIILPQLSGSWFANLVHGDLLYCPALAPRETVYQYGS